MELDETHLEFFLDKINTILLNGNLDKVSCILPWLHFILQEH
jgi:hypothetical protein